MHLSHRIAILSGKMRFVMRKYRGRCIATWVLILFLNAPVQAADAFRSPLAWPAMTREQRPWAYWWWMASAVDKTNLTRELTRYRDGGYGGVHIIPIYGAKGWETNYIPYLSPKWMEAVRRLELAAPRFRLAGAGDADGDGEMAASFDAMKKLSQRNDAVEGQPERGVHAASPHEWPRHRI